MDLLIKFPSETEVILDDVSRFRALTPEQQFQSVLGLLHVGDVIARISPKAAWANQYAEEQKNLVQRLTKEFIARHGY